MIIGNIVFKEQLVNHIKCDYINYIDLKNGGNDLSKIDTSLPTLISGWDLCKSTLPYLWHSSNGDNSIITVSILEKEYQKNRFWEFSFNENKSQHVSGVEMFVRNVPYYYFNQQIKYVNVDPIFKNINDLSDLKSQLPTGDYEVYNHKNQMFYILKEAQLGG